MLFPNLPDSSKVWIYQSQTEISEEMQVEIQQKLNLFISGWAAHGAELFGDTAILENYFVVLAVDEAKVKASGCSIDTSVHFIRSLGESFQLDFFKRMHVLIETNGIKEIVHFSELASHSESFIFDPMITTLGELRRSWKIKISESRFT
jgi:hypothetical protein